MRLQTLEPPLYAALHKLMVAQKFPGVPPRPDDAAVYFRQCRIFYIGEVRRRAGGWTRASIKVAFVFGPAEQGARFLDVVCAPGAQGRWATLPVLRAVFARAFDVHGLAARCLWVQPHHKAALKACLQAGFTPLSGVETHPGAPPLLVLTRLGLPRRFWQDEIV